jgi:hypothetical protein
VQNVLKKLRQQAAAGMAVESLVCKTTSKKSHTIMKSNQSELSTFPKAVRRGVSRLVVLASLGLAGLLAVPQARASSTLASVSVGEQTVGAINPGGTATFPVTVTRTGAGRLDVDLSISGLPAGATATFSPDELTFTGNKPDSLTSTLTITIPASLPLGCSSFTVTASEERHDNHGHNKKTAARQMYVGVGHICLTTTPNGTVTVGCAGKPGDVMVLQTTTNLTTASWTTIATNVTDASGWSTWPALDMTNCPCRFFRTVKP